MNIPSRTDRETKKAPSRRQKAPKTPKFVTFRRGPDTPSDQEHHHREYEADRNLRPYLLAIYERLKPEGSGKCHRATDERHQTNDSREIL